MGLGAILGIKALADLGADWISRAAGGLPRLTEAMLGKQEGALRELLRQFREGDVEQALRRALPLGGTGERGGMPSADGKLPNVDPTYSLQSILGSGRGPTGLWFGGNDLAVELAKEYRKAAEEAERPRRLFGGPPTSTASSSTTSRPPRCSSPAPGCTATPPTST